MLWETYNDRVVIGKHINIAIIINIVVRRRCEVSVWWYRLSVAR